VKKILRITRIELNLLFYSPIAWLLIIIFMVLSGMTFMDKLSEFVGLQEMGKALLPYRHDFTLKIFSASPGDPPFFPGISDMLYWFIPLITMGLMSRETSSGTIKLLFSSPLKVRDIVFGKFVAMMVFNALLMLIMAIIVGIGLVLLQSPDGGQLLSAMLGIYLLLCTYSSIGLFMSCLTSYQVAAALTTFAVFALLNYVGGVWQYIDFVRDLTYFLSIASRTSNMFMGLITTKDVGYFLIIIGLFLAFSFFKLQAGRESRSFWRQAARYGLAFVLALAIGYLSALPMFAGYADLTATSRNTITAGTQELVHQLGSEPMEINSFINVLETQTVRQGLPEERKADEQRWSMYTRFKPDIKFTYTYFYDSVPDPKFYNKYPGRTLRQMAEQAAESFNLDMSIVKTPEEIHRIVAMPLEMGRYCIQLKFRNRTTFLRLSDIDGYRYPAEPEIAAGMKRLLADKMPKYCFLQGELERTPYKAGEKNYSDINKVWLRFALINQGFDMDTIDLHNREIPRDMTGLVIADPRTDFDPVVRKKIQQYIDRGGNLLIMGETGKQVVINPFIQQFGVQMHEGMMIQQSEEYAPDLLQALLTSDALAIGKELGTPRADSLPMVMSGVTSLSYDPHGPYDTRPLLTSDPATSWQRNTMAVLDSAVVRFSAANGDGRGPYTPAVRLTRMVNGREQRIVIMSDADWLANLSIGFPRKYWFQNANNELSRAIFGWMTNGVFPVDLSRPADKDRTLYIAGTSLPYLRLLLTGIMPGILLIMAIILLLRRKRK
jgi:ABC-2 type transport system permease protein